jgi:hypothetical protein
MLYEESDLTGLRRFDGAGSRTGGAGGGLIKGLSGPMMGRVGSPYDTISSFSNLRIRAVSCFLRSRAYI